jgi:hypothetical protein
VPSFIHPDLSYVSIVKIRAVLKMNFNEDLVEAEKTSHSEINNANVGVFFVGSVKRKHK